MSSLVAIAGVLLIAAITPGPSNLVVMRARRVCGFTHALPAAGIVLGSVALAGCGCCGVGVLLARWPLLGALTASAALSCLARAVAAAGRECRWCRTELPAGVVRHARLSVHQSRLMMVLSVVSSSRSQRGDAFDRLAPLFVAFPRLPLAVGDHWQRAIGLLDPSRCTSLIDRSWRAADRQCGLLIV
jgi:hypothetical protein